MDDGKNDANREMGGDSQPKDDNVEKEAILPVPEESSELLMTSDVDAVTTLLPKASHEYSGVSEHTLRDSQLTEQSVVVLPRPDEHRKHCFVVIPFGRSSDEMDWFAGWTKEVIFPAVRAAGYEPIVSVTQDRPSAINDEIRAHLAFDPMVVVDLGGFTPEADPNPNVMYELGIRHALNLPVVMMAWRNQRLPFDITNQRVVMEGRGFIDLEKNRKRLQAFINSAKAGDFYRPMDAVVRIASLKIASETLDRDSLLRDLVDEIRDLREKVQTGRPSAGVPVLAPKMPKTIGNCLNGKSKRKPVRVAFLKAGGKEAEWGKVLAIKTPPEIWPAALAWSRDEWTRFLLDAKSQAAG